MKILVVYFRSQIKTPIFIVRPILRVPFEINASKSMILKLIKLNLVAEHNRTYFS